MPSASCYTNRVKTTAEARNVKVEYPGNVGNLTQSLLPIVCNAPVSRWNMINYLRTCRACVPIPDPPLPIPPPPPPPPPPSAPVVTIINDIPTYGTIFGLDYLDTFKLSVTVTITWECVPPSEVTVELYGAQSFLNASNETLVPGESYYVRQTTTTSGTTFTFDAVLYTLPNVPSDYGTFMYVTITPTGGSPVQGRTVVIFGSS